MPVKLLSDKSNEQERLIGGFITGTFKKVGNFAGGYGVFATSKRIVGVSSSRWFIVLLVGSFLGALGLISGIAAISHVFDLRFTVFGGIALIGAIIVWGQRRLSRKDPRSIEELEARRDFEIYRDNIASVQMKKPGSVKRGHMKIIPLTGEGLNVLITQQFEDYLRLKSLIAQFCSALPQVIFVEEE